MKPTTKRPAPARVRKPAGKPVPIAEVIEWLNSCRWGSYADREDIIASVEAAEAKLAKIRAVCDEDTVTYGTLNRIRAIIDAE